MEKIDFRGLAMKAAKIADDKKAENTIILDVRDLTAISNYFVITTAESTPQINAICSEIERTFKEEGVSPVRREGISSNSWRVIDYGGLVVHVMAPQVRATYNLEKLWHNAKTVQFNDSIIHKITDSKEFKEFSGIIVNAAKEEKKVMNKAAKKVVKKAQKKTKQAQKEIRKNKNVKAIKKGVKKAQRRIKKAEKQIKVDKNVKAFEKGLNIGIKEADRNIKKAKKTIKALSKGVEAFRKEFKKSKKKK